MADEPFTIGIEEEYLLVDAGTLALRPCAEEVYGPARRRVGDQVDFELMLSQLEIGTSICRSLDEARDELVRLRSAVIAAAEAQGAGLVASGTHPFSGWQDQRTTPKARYRQLEDDYQQLARELLICGCHVHVGIPDKGQAVDAMARIRPWLSTVLALFCNSPFWEGVDTGYASYRSEVFGRLPLAGPPPLLGSLEDFDDLVAHLVGIGAMEDATFLYWDARPSSRYATLEVRVADVCQTVDEAVLLAALARSLCRTAVADGERGAPLPRTPQAALEVARWRACRFGVGGELVDAVGRTSRPAGEVVGALLDHLRPDLDAHGELALVEEGVGRILRDGTGADRQRRAAGGDADLVAAARALVRATDPR